MTSAKLMLWLPRFFLISITIFGLALLMSAGLEESIEVYDPVFQHMFAIAADHVMDQGVLNEKVFEKVCVDALCEEEVEYFDHLFHPVKKIGGFKLALRDRVGGDDLEETYYNEDFFRTGYALSDTPFYALYNGYFEVQTTEGNRFVYYAFVYPTES